MIVPRAFTAANFEQRNGEYIPTTGHYDQENKND
jgi:hypothetical protein